MAQWLSGYSGYSGCNGLVAQWLNKSFYPPHYSHYSHCSHCNHCTYSSYNSHNNQGLNRAIIVIATNNPIYCYKLIFRNSFI